MQHESVAHHIHLNYSTPQTTLVHVIICTTSSPSTYYSLWWSVTALCLPNE